MANLKIIRKRIGSVKNTQKITRAMKMVATARLRRAQQAIIHLRPYAQKTMAVLSSVAARAGGVDEAAHPLLEVRPAKRVMMVVITSDRGLAGAFNTNITKKAYLQWRAWEAASGDEKREVTFIAIGRKGRDFFRRRAASMHDKTFTGVFENLSIDRAQEIAATVIDAYTKGNYDAVYLVYNEFKSAISQKATIEQILPIVPEDAGDSPQDFIYEPNKKELLARLLPMYVTVEIFRAILESVASEHGARMTAMDNATRNASELVGKLTLDYNRARQAAITKELMEIIGGAEALKG